MTARTLLTILALTLLSCGAFVYGINPGDKSAETRAAPAPVEQPKNERFTAAAHDPVVDEGMPDLPGENNPDLIIIDVLEEFYGPVPFSHRLHAGMSEMNGGCANCHHELETGDEIMSCGECHPKEIGATLAVPSLKGAYHRQCLGCHRDWAHENACGYCHVEKADAPEGEPPMDKTDIIGIPHPRITAEDTYIYETGHEETPVVTFHHIDHVHLYGLSCADCHQGQTCGRCHDETISREQIDHKETCGSCHDCNKEQSCNFCHSREARPSFDHDTATSFSLRPNHTGIACERCHGDGGQFKTPSTNCFTCHSRLEAGAFDHSATGVPLAGSHAHYACKTCHAERNPERAPTCDSCHADFTYPTYYPGDPEPRQ
jgi:hypothetical protein